MDMTLAEQMVWAAVYAKASEAGAGFEDVDVFRMLCAKKASDTVLRMRESFNAIAKDETLKKRLGHTAFQHLHQMTYKVDD